MSRTARLVILALVLYIGTYVIFRQTHIEVWERDLQRLDQLHVHLDLGSSK